MDVFWLEASPYDFATSQSVTVRACSIDLTPIVMFGGIPFPPVLDGGPSITTTVFNGTFTGRAETASAEIALLPQSGEIDDWASYAWAGRPVQIYRAEIELTQPTAPTFPTSRTLLFDGTADSFDPDSASLMLSTKRPEGKVASKTYAGTGGAEGPAEMKGKTKPFAGGVHANRVPVLVEPGKLMFQIHGYGPVGVLTNIREGGFILDQVRNNWLTVAELRAATVPPGEIHTCLAQGLFRLGFTPFAEITCDFIGHTRPDGNYARTIAAIAYDLLVLSGWDMGKFDHASLTALDAANTNDALYYDDAGTDIMDALTGLLAPAGAYWDVDELGVFYFGVLGIQAAADFAIGDEGRGTYDLLDIDHESTPAPFWKNRVGYGFNPTPMRFAQTAVGATPEQVALIEASADLTDGEVAVLFAANAPLTANENDLWHDTVNGFWYKRVGGLWELTGGLGALGAALVNAAGAEALADGKVTTFYQDATPTTASVGDLWIRPVESPRILRTFDTVGGWPVVSTFGADPTLANTAAGIVGQAPTATSSDFSVVTGPTRPENNATAGAVVGVNIRLPTSEVVDTTNLLNSSIEIDSAIGDNGRVYARLRRGGTIYQSQFDTGIEGNATFGATFDLNLREGTLIPGNPYATRVAYRTDQGQAASIIGQGNFATRSGQWLDNGRLWAESVGYDSGIAVRDLQPGEANANRTEGRQAASILGQSNFATSTDMSYATGRITNPLLYNTQAIVGPRNTSNVNPSYSDNDGASWAVTIPAHTRYVASVSGPLGVVYGASSHRLAYGTYWASLTDDPNLAGNTGVGVISDPVQLLYAGRYHIASGIIPQSDTTGGDTGGGGGGSTVENCVEMLSHMPTGGRANRVRAGDEILALNEETWSGAILRTVTANKITAAECVEITSSSGIRLVLSLTTPCTLKGGDTVLAEDVLGHELAVQDADGFRWERIASIESAGTRLVAHISCDQGTYFAGAEPGRYIATHNVVFKP